MSGNAPLSIAWGRREGNAPLDVGRSLSTLRGQKGEAEVLQAFDARGVAGPRHVTSAYLHMQRALTTGRTRLRDHGAILAVYLAGTDQLERALGRVGLQADTREIVLVRSPAGELSEVLRSLGFSASPPQEAQGPTEETLRRLGIDVPASGGVPRERWELLVLEQTAMVDLPR